MLVMNSTATRPIIGSALTHNNNKQTKKEKNSETNKVI
jgi:hypothetical protein